MRDDGDFWLDQAFRRGRTIIALAEIDHPNGLNRLWTGNHELHYDGTVWTGLQGALARVMPAPETTTLAIKEVTLELAGVPPVATAHLSARVRGRRARVWIAAMGPRNNVIGSPDLIIDSKLDYQKMPVADNGLVTIQLIGHVGFFSSERAVNKAWTHEEQQVEFPGDTGMSLIPELTDKEVRWRLS